MLLTPHVGGSTEEASRTSAWKWRASCSSTATTARRQFGQFPRVSLPEHPGKHRLLHIHHNRPGVLSRINAIFSEQRINIAGQYLQTNARIGYVVIDLDSHERAETLHLKKRLEEVDGTIRSRILY